MTAEERFEVELFVRALKQKIKQFRQILGVWGKAASYAINR